MLRSPVTPDGHVNNFTEACSCLAKEQQDDLISLESCVRNHEIECCSDAFLHLVWFHDYARLPHPPSLLPEKCRGIGLIRRLMRLLPNSCMIWSTRVFHLSKMFTFQRG